MAQIDNITSVDTSGSNIVVKTSRLVSGSAAPQTFTFTKADVAAFGLAKLIANVDVNLVTAVPASSSSTGALGDMVYSSGFLYVCTATNTWRRVALVTF